jgi:hypothetical protein
MTNITLVPPVYYNVKKDGAVGDGTTDDTTAIAAARSAVNSAGGGIVFYPPGTYISGNQTLYNNVIDMGSGSGSTIIKLKNGANTDLFSASTASINLAASFGSGSTGGAHDFAICGLTLDGNKANQTSGTSYCVRVYGYRFLVRDVIVQNGYTGGWLSDWNGGSAAPGSNTEESATWDNVFFTNNNGIGFQAGGPHDARMIGCNSYLNGLHCFHITPNMVGLKASQSHGYATLAGVSAVPWLIEANYCKFVDCIAEGADNTEVVFLSQESSWIGGHIFADTTPNSVIGIQLGQHAGGTPWPSSINQSAGVTTDVVAIGNVIDTTISECQSGAISFADEWKSFYRIYCHQSGGTAVASTLPDPTDNFWIVVVGLTPDGSLGKSGGMQISSSAFNGLTFWNQSGNEFFAVNPNSSTFGMGNGGIFRGYSDGFTTLKWSIESTNGNIATSGNVSVGQSATAAALATGGTITTANIGEARVAPTAAVTGIILQSGTVGGQTVTVVNESAFTVTFAASATSHVADGVSAIIAANRKMDFTWNSATSLWYHS